MRVVDLVHDLPKAETRPTSARFEVAEHTFSSVRHASIVAPAPSRMTWTLNFPARGLLRAWVAVAPEPGAPSSEASVTFRVGVSDARIYEPLAQRTVTTAETEGSGWMTLTADLSRYGGRQWSVFFRPDSHPWRLILNTDATSGLAVALWGAVGIDTDQRAARAWWERTGRRASASTAHGDLADASGLGNARPNAHVSEGWSAAGRDDRRPTERY